MASKQKEGSEAPSATTATAAIQLDADDKVTLWRISQLKRADYSDEAATQIGGWAHIDLHLACDMRAQGCSEEHALAILL